MRNLDNRRAALIAQDALSGRPLPAEHGKHQRLPTACDPYNGTGQYGVVQRFVEERDWQQVIATLKQAKLRGMGGAGFRTGLKWEIVRNAAGSTKYIVCNADESEPGTIKDRHIMENVPYLVMEGMIIAGLVTGAHKGILYIRHEYDRRKQSCKRNSTALTRMRVLGPRRLGSDLDLRPRDLCQPRRLHLRRGKRAAGSHRRQPRGAAQQTALSRTGRRRLMGPADRHQQRRDLHARHRDSGARSGLVQGARQERCSGS